MTDRVIEVVVPTTVVEVYGALKGAPGTPGADGVDGSDGVDGDTGPTGATGPEGEAFAVSALNNGVAGDATTDDTAALQALLAGAWPFPERYILPSSAVGYKVSGTLPIPQSSQVMGTAYQGSRIYPVSGMAVPVFDFGSNGGTGLSDIAIWNLVNSGSAGTPAIVMGGQQQRLERVEIRGWKGRGVDVTTQNQSTLRNVLVASCVEDAFTVATTYTLLDSCTASGNGGHGFVLKDSQFANGSGILTGCVAENNTGHGFYVIGGDWELSVYGESNGGDLLHVDGMQQFDTSMTLTADAHIGDTSITVSSLSKGLPAKSILRFADGSIAVIDNNDPGPVIGLAVPLTVDKASGSTLTLAAEDVHPSRLPTVHLHSGTHDGHIYLIACNYTISANFPISANFLATPSARLIGEPLIKGRSNTVTVNYGGGGSEALGAVTGAGGPVIANGLSPTANPTNLYFLTGTMGGPCRVDEDVPGGFFHRLTSQFQLVIMPNGWDLKSLTPGDYTVRALVRDASQTASNIDLIIASESTTTFTTRTADWEWISVDFTMTDDIRSAGGTQSIAVQRKTVTSDVDVATIQLIPKLNSVVLPGTWQNPTRIGSNADLSVWTDSGNLYFKDGLPANATDGTALGGSSGSGFASNVKLDLLDYPSTAWSGGTVAPVGAIPSALGGYYLSAGDNVQRDMEFLVGMKAGTWNFVIWYEKYVNGGDLSVVVDGTESSTFDTYAAGAAIASSTFSVSVATDGIKTIKIRQKGTKNASSAGYYIFFSALNGYTT